MINKQLTEDFIEEHYFILDKPYSVPMYDENGFSTGKYKEIPIGSEWEISDDSYIGGEIHLNGLSLDMWLEISLEKFKTLFSAHKFISESVSGNTHEVIYYTIEDNAGFIFKEFDTLEEAEIWIKENKEDEMHYICGFKQIRDEEEDVLDEFTIYERRVR